MIQLKQNDVILFQGDSVTDCGRDRRNPCELGTGYPMVVASMLSHRLRDLNLTFLNRGVSGDRVRELKARWSEDCIALKPTVVSILIGINDTWQCFREQPQVSEDFESDYREILTRTRNETDARILLMEPFVTPYPDDRKAWRHDLDDKLAAVRGLAVEFGASLVPLDGLFAAAFAAKPGGYYADDGVHPSYAGHGLIAEAWLRGVGGVMHV